MRVSYEIEGDRKRKECEGRWGELERQIWE